MITPTEIRQKASRLYLSFLQSWARGETFFPRSLTVGSLPLSNYAQLREGVQLLIAQSKEQQDMAIRLTLRYIEHISTSHRTFRNGL